jgi:hypothetical protein
MSEMNNSWPQFSKGSETKADDQEALDAWLNEIKGKAATSVYVDPDKKKQGCRFARKL